jgi:hypothetical protein
MRSVVNPLLNTASVPENLLLELHITKCMRLHIKCMRAREQNKRLVHAPQKLYKLCRFSSTQAGPIFYFLKHINETTLLRQPSTSPLPMNVYAAANLMSSECILRSYIVHCISISYLDMNIIYSRLVCISYEVYFIRIHGSTCCLFFFLEENGPPFLPTRSRRKKKL